MSRWDWIEGVKAETPTRVAVRELCKVMAKELSAWPPELEWNESQQSQSAKRLFDAEGNVHTPSSSAVGEAAKRLDWEFSRAMDAIDYYQRNRVLEKSCEGPEDCLASEFLFEYLREGLFSLMERTEGRVRRADILEGLPEMKILLQQIFGA
ncbi:MAG: hypothetical protein JKY56_01360 [Kofleriaceae bacterium]|nr:hypothetical protein [Kofleriaceae bacterium]